MLKSISFHPKLAAVLDVVINVLMILWLRHLTSWTMMWVWLCTKIIIWAILIWRVYYPKELKPWKHLLSLSLMTVGALAFFLFIEWPVAWYVFAGFFSFFSCYRTFKCFFSS